MKPTFIISLLLFSFIATCTTLAQHSTYHISGRVTDTEGEPLPGATISIKGKGTGAVTSVDGTYTLQLPGTGTYLITASYVGYQPQEKRLTVGKEKRLSFRLSEDQFDLGTVVVTGTRTPKLLKDAPIIILDEATSALDNESEHIVQQSLEKLAKGRTVFTIAHRLTTIKGADCIWVLTEKGVEEQGSHTELIAKGGLYAHLFAMYTSDR